MSDISIVKRTGQKEALDLEKLHKVVFYSCEGVSGVSPSQVELTSHISFSEGMTTSEIQETLIKAAADLISEETPNYQFVAGRLITYHLRKEAYGQFEPPLLIDIVKHNIDAGMYDKLLLDWYDEDE